MFSVPVGGSEGFSTSPVGAFTAHNRTFHSSRDGLCRPIMLIARGHRFILVRVDYATRFPIAIPLCMMKVLAMAQALMSVIVRVGVP